jgi:hypothetical protein
VADEENLTVENLRTPAALIALGTIAVTALQERGIVTIFVTAEGKVELCPPGEIELDSLPEAEALDRLLDRGYSDPEIVMYLRGRDARFEAAAKLQTKRETSSGQ